MAKTFSTELKSVLVSAVEMVNFVKLKSLKTRICHGAGLAVTLCFYILISAVCQRVKSFARLRELLCLFNIENPDFASLLNDEEFCVQ